MEESYSYSCVGKRISIEKVYRDDDKKYMTHGEVYMNL